MYCRAKRVGAVALLLVCIFVGLVAAAEAAPKYKWQLASPFNNPVKDKGLTFFIEKVKEYSGGDIELTYYANGLLGSHDETFHGVRDGIIEMAMLCPYVNLVPGGMLNWMPWTVSNYDEARIAYAYPDGILFKVMQEAWREVNMELIFNSSEGGYGIANNVRPLKTPEDLKNLKLRVSSSLAYVRALENLGKGVGLTFETIAWAELYNALSRGVVDGCWDTYVGMVDSRHGEVIKYYTHEIMGGWNAFNIVINKELWDGLEPKYQEALFKAGSEAERNFCDLFEAEDRRYIQAMKTNYPNLTLTELTPEEVSVWKDRADMPSIWAGLADPWLDKVWPGEKMGEKIRAELDSIRKQVAEKKKK
ncbi:MAG: TRAP transporter substrate-binding protein [Synergistaceae bacterium]|nr:TRAP transporter substrate-binding protein [Synergistaceae bacterium]